MNRLDPLNCAIWFLMGLWVVAVWAWLFSLFVPTIAEALAAAGMLADCEALALTAADCAALAGER